MSLATATVEELVPEPVYRTEEVRQLPRYRVELEWREWVTIRRIRLGITKGKLGELTGLSRRTLWLALEATDGVPSVNVQKAVEDALNVAEDATRDMQ